MFIQSAAPGQSVRAVTMYDHGHFSGQIARLFGNKDFEAPEPFEEVVYAISNHDAGWAAFDRDPATDPQSGVPYSVFATPAPLILPTSSASPDFNQRHSAYAGLLSSMHTWGIYNGRYGFSNAGRLSRISDADKPAVEAMLAREIERQKKLKAELSNSLETARWIEEGRLFQNYKLLQFCDLMAIYFNYTHAAARGVQELTHVPMSPSRDVNVTITPRGGSVYALAPYPLVADGIELAFPSRPISPSQHEREGGWAKTLRETPPTWETIRLVAG